MTISDIGTATSARPAFKPNVLQSYVYRNCRIDIVERPDAIHAKYAVYVTRDGKTRKTDCNWHDPMNAIGEGRLVVDEMMDKG